MRALTLWQPWAHAILHCGKRVENRPWPPPYTTIGEVIAIHAGARYEANGWSFPTGVVVPPKGTVPQRAIVGAARVLGFLDLRGLYRQCVGCADAHALDGDPWWAGPVGWLLGDVVALAEPVPCKGALGLWRLPPDVEAAVQRELRRGTP